MKEKALKILNDIVLPEHAKGKTIKTPKGWYWLEISPPQSAAKHEGGFYLFAYREGEISTWGNFLHPETCDTEETRNFFAQFIIEHETDLRELAKIN